MGDRSGCREARFRFVAGQPRQEPRTRRAGMPAQRKRSANHDRSENPRQGARQNSTWPAPQTGRGSSAASLVQEPEGPGWRFSRKQLLTLARLRIVSRQAVWPATGCMSRRCVLVILQVVLRFRERILPPQHTIYPVVLRFATTGGQFAAAKRNRVAGSRCSWGAPMPWWAQLVLAPVTGKHWTGVRTRNPSCRAAARS